MATALPYVAERLCRFALYGRGYSLRLDLGAAPATRIRRGYMMRTKAIAAAILSMLGAGMFQQAQAQTSNSCNGRIVVDTIYQTGTGGNNFEYFIHVRNATRQALTVDVHFSGFPMGVTLFSASLPGIPIGANATISGLRFGRGSLSQINTATVARIYDASPGAGATVRLTNCRPA